MNEDHDLFYDPDDEVTKSEVEDNYGYEYDDRSESSFNELLSSGNDF